MLALKCSDAVPQHWQITLLPGLLASVGNELSVDLNQLIEIQLLFAAAGVCECGCCREGDLAPIPALEQLLDEGEGCVDPSRLHL